MRENYLFLVLSCSYVPTPTQQQRMLARTAIDASEHAWLAALRHRLMRILTLTHLAQCLSNHPCHRPRRVVSSRVASQRIKGRGGIFAITALDRFSCGQSLLFEGLRAITTRDARSIVRLFFSQIRWRKYYLKYEIAKYSFWKIWARREFPCAHFV